MRTNGGPRGPEKGADRAGTAGGAESVEPADPIEAGLGEPQRAIMSVSLGVLLGTLLAKMAVWARRRRLA
ncbi:MAG TPA: hypothetical protein VGS09_12850 [Actinomycetota bacterium]|jgi:hypothetical protein|nr:hypothetical protein [Actinomycetota bacterium]